MPTNLCSITQCEKNQQARGWCQTHYQRWLRDGSPGAAKIRQHDKSMSLRRNPNGEKYCRKCEQWQPIQLFTKSKSNPDGLYSYCSDCVRNTARKSKYNIDASQYLAKTGYQCPICCRPIDEKSSDVDHDHACCPGDNSCGECVRGMLCRQCNRGLGFFEDNTERLINAVKYIEQSDKSCRI